MLTTHRIKFNAAHSLGVMEIQTLDDAIEAFSVIEDTCQLYAFNTPTLLIKSLYRISTQYPQLSEKYLSFLDVEWSKFDIESYIAISEIINNNRNRIPQDIESKLWEFITPFATSHNRISSNLN